MVFSLNSQVNMERPVENNGFDEGSGQRPLLQEIDAILQRACVILQIIYYGLKIYEYLTK